MTDITPEKLEYYKAVVNSERKTLTTLMRELKRDKLLWAADQVCDIIRELEELQIEAEEPTEDDLHGFWTPGTLLDVGQVITLADGKEYTVVDTNNERSKS